MTGPGRRFRLRGELAGRERRFPLPSGEVWIGSARANDVVLPLRGVSRRHARLFVDAEGARLEDLDSKNGVAVNGTQVGQARLEAGDEIRFGPAQLRFEEVDAEDVELAGDPTEALAFLLQDLGAAGGCIVEWPARNDEPAVLAAHWELPSLAHEGLRELPRQESHASSRPSSTGVPTSPPPS